MELTSLFFVNSFFLGIGLSMDAFSVSLVNGMHSPKLGIWKVILIAGVYGFFQALMPMIGWVFSHELISLFGVLRGVAPWIAMGLLVFVGSKMIMESSRPCETGACFQELSLWIVLLQGLATSVDALSVGLTLVPYDFSSAFLCSLIIALVTFVVSHAGIAIGRRVGDRLSGRATRLGGGILICIGIEIMLSHSL